MKKLENLKGKKLGNMKSIIAGKKPSLGVGITGPCGGNGSDSDPYVLETLTLIKGGGGSNDGCD